MDSGALVRDPPLLLIDEPTANLDTGRGIQVVEMLAEQNYARGTDGDPRPGDGRARRSRAGDRGRSTDRKLGLLDGDGTLILLEHRAH